MLGFFLFPAPRSKDSLTSLCGFSGKETELDFSKQDLGPGDAVLIANDIRDNGALEKLLMAKNKMGTKEAGEALGRALAQNSVEP